MARFAPSAASASAAANPIPLVAPVIRICLSFTASGSIRSGPITVVFGAVLGVLVSLCSVGAGALGVAVLFFLYPRLPPVRIVGSDLAHAVPLTLVAGMGHWLIGSVDWPIVGALLLGSLLGISVVSHVRPAFQIASCSPSWPAYWC